MIRKRRNKHAGKLLIACQSEKSASFLNVEAGQHGEAFAAFPHLS
jgi:hypothetical protein